MKVEMIPVEGLLTRVLIIHDDDESFPCENCGKESFSHELLAKEDTDWCMDCNDKHYRAAWTEDQYAKWYLNRMMEGKIVLIVKDYK
jgi:hypothetical protein|tara:strand:+ start:152 stop:412 length:261 start_codon:yes stop_codon:yes gene_type:complete